MKADVQAIDRGAAAAPDHGASLRSLLLELKQRGIRLTLDAGRLGISAPKGTLDDTLRERLRQNKEGLIALLSSEAAREEEASSDVTVEPDEVNRHEPFGLTETQHAYWMGRNAYFELGGVATHLYLEFEQIGLDLARLNEALHRVIARHDMLRAVIEPEGRQRILPTAPSYRIEVLDVVGLPQMQANEELATLRHRMLHTQLPTDACPLIEVRAANLGHDRLRLCIKLDMLIIDASSLYLFFEDWRRYYEDPTWTPEPLRFSYRDYALFEQGLPQQPAFERAKAYWFKRLDGLPSAPDLPLAVQPAHLEQRIIVRRDAELEREQWQALKEQAQRHGVTPSVLLMCAFSDVLRTWARSSDFTLNLTMFNRFPVHPQVQEIIGDFTTTSLLAVHVREQDSFVARLQRLQQQMVDDMAHREFSGMRVLRERTRRLRNAPGAAMPVVFTSSIALGSQQSTTDSLEFLGDYVYGSSQTPQVWLDHLTEESKGQLMYCWDALEALFPPGLLDDMFGAYGRLLQRLAHDPQSWHQAGPLVELPAWQQALLAQQLRTETDLPPRLLHEMVAEQAYRCPDAPAVIWPAGAMTYRELHCHAARLAHRLRAMGVRSNTLVAVSMDKGWEQVAAVLGVLHSGAAYLPIEPSLPQERRWHLARRGEVRVVITQALLREVQSWPPGVQAITLDDHETTQQPETLPEAAQAQADLAYVIFTSGSTGEPKGVMIDHRGAANTVQDINRRFRLGGDDRVLALSALNFDLSVWDIFGPLSSGGAIVMPDPHRTADPLHWSELIAGQRVTVWNSVPALLQIWADHLQDRSRGGTPPPNAGARTLRLAMLSGDWIPVRLPDQARQLCPGLQVVSLGGATEASIWSIGYPIGHVDPQWKSIPYGKALANQTMHVLDEHLQPRPVWSVGRIYIGGVGVAVGYWRDAQKTAERFVRHPRTGERLYHTGDLGRLLPDGNIEFLGRDDFQVKINGYRIELGEIAAHLRRLEGVREAVAHVVVEPRNGQRQLVGYLLPEDGAHMPWQARVEQGEVASLLAQALPEYMVPRHYVVLRQWPLSANGKVDLNALPVPWLQQAQAQQWVAPRTATEQALAAAWREVLQHDEFGIDTSFFEAGGDSLTAVRIAGLVCETLGRSPQIQRELLQQIFRHPTIEAQARILDRQHGERPDQEAVRAGDAMAWRKELSSLLPTLDLKAVQPPVTRSRTVLLTGATGFVGVHLLARLLSSTDMAVFALVRGSSAEEALRRVRRELELASTPEIARSPRLSVVVGDLTLPRLGLQATDWERLTSTVDEVIHSAASVNYLLSYEELKAANVQGTLEVIRLCSTHRHKRLHHISSLASKAIEVVVQQPVLAQDRSGGGQGYGHSKFAADQLVRHAHAQGLQAVRYRLEDLMPSLSTGYSNQKSLVDIFMRVCLRERMMPTHCGTIPMLSVERLAAWLVRFVGDDAAFRRLAPAVDVMTDAAVPVEDFLAFVATQAGLALAPVSYADFLAHVKGLPDPEAMLLANMLPAPHEVNDESGIMAWGSGDTWEVVARHEPLPFEDDLGARLLEFAEYARVLIDQTGRAGVSAATRGA